LPLCLLLRNNPLRCVLFTYNGNLVAIDLVGAVIPLIVSILIVALLLNHSRGRFRIGRAAKYAVLAAALGGLGASEYTIWGRIFGTLSVDALFFELSLILPAGVLQFWYLDRSRRIEAPVLKSYVVGTLGLLVSDLIRTFSGALDVSPQIIGAREFLDAIFLAGPLLMLFYAMSALAYFTYNKSGSISH